MPMIEPPSDEALCRYVLMANAIGKCVYVIPENDSWLPTEDDVPPEQSANGEYYEVFPTGGKIQRCRVGIHDVLERLWWSDMMMRQYQRRDRKETLAVASRLTY